MDQKTVPHSFFNLPSSHYLPQLNQQLKMFNTNNAIPLHLDDISPFLHADLHQNQLQDSFAQGISECQSMVNTTAKKKKSGCMCKKTFCLKMYCECFSKGKSCDEDCGCSNCKNLLEYRQQVLTAKNSVKGGTLRNSSLSQKRCNCKKSHCLKRYCECFNSGVGCSQFCKCESCQNPHKIQKSQQTQRVQFKEPMRQLEDIAFTATYEIKSIEDFQKFYT